MSETLNKSAIIIMKSLVEISIRALKKFLSSKCWMIKSFLGLAKPLWWPCLRCIMTFLHLFNSSFIGPRSDHSLRMSLNINNWLTDWSTDERLFGIGWNLMSRPCWKLNELTLVFLFGWDPWWSCWLYTAQCAFWVLWWPCGQNGPVYATGPYYVAHVVDTGP